MHHSSLRLLSALSLTVLGLAVLPATGAAGTKEVEITTTPVPVQETRDAFYATAEVVIPANDIYAPALFVGPIPADRVLVLDAVSIHPSFATTSTTLQVWANITPNVDGELGVSYATPPKFITIEISPPGGSYFSVPASTSGLGLSLPPESSVGVSLYQNSQVAFARTYRVAVSGYFLSAD